MQLKDGRRKDIDDSTTENLERVAGFIDNISVGDAIVKCGAVYVKSWQANCSIGPCLSKTRTRYGVILQAIRQLCKHAEALQ